MNSSKRILAAVSISTITAIRVNAALTPYTAQDTGVGPSQPFPNSAAAAATYLAAAPHSSLITFENAATGTFSSLAAAPGVTITGSTFLAGRKASTTPRTFPPRLLWTDSTPPPVAATISKRWVEP